MIKTDRGLVKNFESILIDRKIASIDRNSRKKKKKTVLRKTAQFLHKILQALKNMSKMHEYEMQRFSETQVLNPVIPNLRFSNILHKFSSIKYVLHKNSKYSQTWLVRPKTHTITCIMFSKEYLMLCVKLVKA